MSNGPEPGPDDRLAPRGLLLFDGGCALCRRSVRLLLALDRRRALRFAPLGGPTAAALLGAQRPAGGEGSVVFVAPAAAGPPRLLHRSAAIAAALAATGAPGSIAGALLRLVPVALRDGIYDAVARRRRRDPARAARCPLPAPGESDRFLP